MEQRLPTPRILIVTDAWHPQVNGVVRTYERVQQELQAMGVEVTFLTPQGHRTLPMPTYPEIRLAVVGPGSVRRAIEAARPHFIHIATEGPLGLWTRRWAISQKQAFTTAYHTRFPEYVAARMPVPVSWGYAFERWFHNAGTGTMVATPSLRSELERKGFSSVMRWTRGVDTEMFHPRNRTRPLDPRSVPRLLYVGRLAVEKNLETFLQSPVAGEKIVVGDGPEREVLAARYPDARFLGKKEGRELAAIYADADVFVFPSLTDTFGIVLLEAMASGVPVAGFDVTGPKDVVAPGVSGVLADEPSPEALAHAIRAAMHCPRADVRGHAEGFSWRACAELFLANVSRAHFDHHGSHHGVALPGEAGFVR